MAGIVGLSPSELLDMRPVEFSAFLEGIEKREQVEWQKQVFLFSAVVNHILGLKPMKFKEYAKIIKGPAKKGKKEIEETRKWLEQWRKKSS